MRSFFTGNNREQLAELEQPPAYESVTEKVYQS